MCVCVSHLTAFTSQLFDAQGGIFLLYWSMKHVKTVNVVGILERNRKNLGRFIFIVQ